MKSTKCAQLSSLSAQSSLSLESVWHTAVLVKPTRHKSPLSKSTDGASLGAIRLELDKGTIVREGVVSQKSIYP